MKPLARGIREHVHNEIRSASLSISPLAVNKISFLVRSMESAFFFPLFLPALLNLTGKFGIIPVFRIIRRVRLIHCFAYLLRIPQISPPAGQRKIFCINYRFS